MDIFFDADSDTKPIEPDSITTLPSNTQSNTPPKAGSSSPAAPLDEALRYAARGWPVVPLHCITQSGACSCGRDSCHSPGKHPRTPHGVKDATCEESQVRDWWSRWPDANVGIRTGPESGLVVLDVDPRNGGDESLEQIQQDHGPLPDTLTGLTGGGGEHRFFRYPSSGERIGCKSNLGDYAGLDVKADGGYVVAPPSNHASGGDYRWAANPERVEIAELPDWLADLARKPRQKSALSGTGGPATGGACPTPAPGTPIPDGRRNDSLASLAGSMRHREMSPAAIEAALLEENREHCDPPLSDDEVRGIAQSISSYPAGSVPEDLTDLGNARRLVRDHEPDLLHCEPWRRWLLFDGRRWANDQTGEVMRRAKATVQFIAIEAAACTDDKMQKKLYAHAQRSQAESRLKAMINLAASEEGIYAVPDDFDADPMVLNVANGTIDLASGTVRPHNRADRIMKLVPVEYDPVAICPQWLAFLEQVLPDPEVRDFLQKAVGYSLTGRTDEQVLFLLYGTGANGKSTFLEIIREIVGDYGCHTPAETLLAKRDTGIPNDVARLMGRRFVYAVESEEGQPLAEARIKSLTGGDTISARFMRAEWFEFRPQLKLWMGTNHKPCVRGTDYAIWRRIRLVPFTVTIPEARRDPALLDKLRQELPGILRWAIEGCRLWQQHGLVAPQAVFQATATYQEEEDLFGDFLDDEFDVSPGGWVSVKANRQVYEAWCQRVGQRPLDAREFNGKLRERGFEEKKYRGDRGWAGLTLKANDAARATSTDDDDPIGNQIGFGEEIVLQ